MLTIRQRLARISGAYLHGFLVVAVAITPFDMDFHTNLLKAGWGGGIACLYQVYEMSKEYGRTKKSNR